ncbi:hypothetical protein PTKIN_Ptkin14bG0056500 [Pterospermum kingtungense]
MAKRLRVSKRVDRFSCLPDELLGHIISFLPVKDVVRASSLSTRWSKVFSLISNLDFQNCYKTQKSESDSFMDFVDRVLLSHTGDVDRLGLKCGEFINSSKVDEWILYALQNNVKDLDLWLICGEFMGLPDEVFTCKTLASLKLDLHNNWKYALKLPVKVCLPSLKVLHLSGIEFSDDDSTRRLFSSCSVLEELVVKMRFAFLRKGKFSVCSPTLKKLTIDIAHNATNYKIVIDAPILVYFSCLHLPRRFLLKNLNSLVKADIYLGLVFGPGYSLFGHNAAGTDLLRGISNVQTLYLSCTFGEVFLKDSTVIPELPKLTYLHLDGHFLVGWERVLPRLLASFPCIEAFVLKVKQPYSRDNSEVMLPSETFPSFLLSQLKKLTIMSFKGKKDELHMVKHFLENAQALENFTVQIIARKGKTAEIWRSMITKKILKLQKVSKKCEVLVSFLT